MSINLADCYEAIADAIADREAVVVEDTRWTYAELDREANKVGHFLQSLGLGRNDHIAMHMRNSGEFIATLVGALKVSVVPVNINFRYTAAELEYLYSNSDARAAFVDPEFCPLLVEVLPRLPELRHVVVVGEVPAELADACRDAGITAHAFHDGVDGQSDARDFPERSGDDHFMVYTGGTTGNPKGVVWRHEDFYYAALAGGNQNGDPIHSTEELGAQAASNGVVGLLVTAPLIHGAAVYALLSMFFMGAKQVIMRTWDAVDALRLIESEKLNVLMVVGDAMAVPFVD